jgi:2-amino-4-hydroxy-6-hydroxymethyldihydropteridine diphosphokinase
MVLNTVIISIGSNIDAKKNISLMLDLLSKETEIIKVSRLVKTKPIGIEDQPDFTNGAVKIETLLQRENLNQLLKSIEDQLGRDRTAAKFGPAQSTSILWFGTGKLWITTIIPAIF